MEHVRTSVHSVARHLSGNRICTVIAQRSTWTRDHIRALSAQSGSITRTSLQNMCVCCTPMSGLRSLSAPHVVISFAIDTILIHIWLLTLVLDLLRAAFPAVTGGSDRHRLATTMSEHIQIRVHMSAASVVEHSSIQPYWGPTLQRCTVMEQLRTSVHSVGRHLSWREHCTHITQWPTWTRDHIRALSVQNGSSTEASLHDMCKRCTRMSGRDFNTDVHSVW